MDGSELKAPKWYTSIYFVSVVALAAPLAVVLILILIKSNGNQPVGDTDNQYVEQSGGTGSESHSPGEQSTTTPSTPEKVVWHFNDQEWIATLEAPACPDPLVLQSPVDHTLPTSILFPGQYRGGDYKAHGGFRFDSLSTNQVEVRMPNDAYLYSGSRYIESGEVQYLLDFQMPCGVMFRFDHLLTLTPELMAIVDAQLPQAAPDDSRGYPIQSEKLYEAGELIATHVGHTSPRNVAVDFGVYDLRSPNSVSLQSSWAEQQYGKRSQTYYAICWIEYLDVDSKSVISKLKQIGNEGSRSDYCDITN